MMKRFVALVFAAAWLSVCSISWSQAIFATLSGTVTDQSGAVVPNAQVTLTNATSGTTRQSVSNAQGFYTFASVPVGTYDLSVTSSGFQTYQFKAIALGGGDLKTVNVAMKVGNTTQTVEITATGDMLTPESTGEKTDTLSTVQLQNYVQTGSNAGEYLKIMPSFGQPQLRFPAGVQGAGLELQRRRPEGTVGAHFGDQSRGNAISRRRLLPGA
jgi:hypothetical protein